MKNRLLALAVLGLVAAVAVAASASGSQRRVASDELNGAGSSFVFPLVSAFQPTFRSGSGIKVNYNPIGSGGGIKAIQERTVDFGASDAPLTPDQFTNCKGCVQIPWALSATSIAYRGAGLPKFLHMTGQVLAQIYMGDVKTWDDPAIKAINAGANLPNKKITPIYRSDASGTSYNFTDYLAKVSPAWKSKIGVGTQPSFPVGVGGAKSAGVAGVLSQTDGGITYVDVAYAIKNNFSVFRIKNKAGKWVTPTLPGITAAASTVTKIPANNELHIVDAPSKKKNAYPISTFTYIILPTNSPKAKQLRQFVFWAMTTGTKQFAAPLLFAPLPHNILVAAEKTLKRVQVQS